MIISKDLIEDGSLVIEQICILISKCDTEDTFNFQLHFKKNWKKELEDKLPFTELEELKQFYLKNANNISYVKVLQTVDPNIVQKYKETLTVLNYLFYEFNLQTINIKLNEFINLMKESIIGIQSDRNDWQQIDSIINNLNKKFNTLVHEIEEFFNDIYSDIQAVYSFASWFEAAKSSFNTHWFLNEAPEELEEVLTEFSLIAASINNEKLNAIGTAIQVRQAQQQKKDTRVFKQQDIEENIKLTYQLTGSPQKLMGLTFKSKET